MKVLVAAMLLMASLKPDSGRLAIYQEGRKIGTEEYSIVERDDGFLLEGRTRITVEGQDFDLRSRMEVAPNLQVRRYEYRGPGARLTLEVGDPLTEFEVFAGNDRQHLDIRFPDNAVILEDNFFHHYLLLVHRYPLGSEDVPVYLPQQMMRLGYMDLRALGNGRFEVQTDNSRVLIETDAEGRMMRLTVPDANVVVERESVER